MILFPDLLTDDPKGETPESIWGRIEHAIEGSIEVFLVDRRTTDKARKYVETHAGPEDEYMKIGEMTIYTGSALDPGQT